MVLLLQRLQLYFVVLRLALARTVVPLKGVNTLSYTGQHLPQLLLLLMPGLFL